MTAHPEAEAAAVQGVIVPARMAAVATGGCDAQDEQEALIWAFIKSRRTANTKAAYNTDVRQWLAWCRARGLDIRAASQIHVDLYAEELTERFKPRTVHRKLAAITRLYRYASKVGAVAANPAADVERPKVDRGVSPTLGLDLDDTQKIITAAEEDTRADAYALRARALVAVLFIMGLRISEALSMDVEHFGEARGHRVVKIFGKGGRVDLVAVPPPAWAALSAYIGDRTTGPVFLSRYGKRWNRTDAWRETKRLARAAGVSEHLVHPHVFRHTAATETRTSGTDIRATQLFLRHARIETTLIYDHALSALDGSPAYALAARFYGNRADQHDEHDPHEHDTEE